jgi:Domain of unknown function (DUF4388)
MNPNPATNPQKFQGEFTRDSLPALLQYFAVMGSSGTLLLRNETSEISSMTFVQGRIVDARCGTLAGQSAFFSIMGWLAGQFQFRTGQSQGQVSIDLPLEQLLNESNRWQTKQTFNDPTLEPDSVIVLNLSHSVEQVQLDNLQLQVLLQAQQQRRAAQVAAHLGLSFQDARKAIIDLWRIGLIEVQAPVIQALGEAFINEFITAISSVLGPVARLVAEDAASDLGTTLEKLEAGKLMAFKNTIEAQVDPSRLAKFKGLIDPLIKRYQQ